MIGKTVIGKSYNVLILGTKNSTRSIMAEALFNSMGHGVFNAYSAGSNPSVVNRFAIEEIKTIDYPTKTLRSKSWDEFMQPEAPNMDFVITICDKLANQSQPKWRGEPITAHIGFDDPANVDGSFDEKKDAFKKSFLKIQHMVELFTQLPLAHLDQAAFDRAMEKWETLNTSLNQAEDSHTHA